MYTFIISLIRVSLIWLSAMMVTLHAQDGIVKGFITDAENREPLPGANIVISGINIQTGAAAESDGSFQVSDLMAGTYQVSVSYIGYETKVLPGISLAGGEVKNLDIALTLSGIEINPIAVSASRRSEKILEAPASITVLEAMEISPHVNASSASLLKNVTGVDFVSTGVDRHEIVLRGFNNAFSGATYIMTDYRQAAVPSLAVNLHSIMPNLSIDLDRIEIVRGPGSALYGAGVDAGVIHYISKDPFHYPGTSVSLAGGERSMMAGQVRHAGVTGHLGYKITAQYARANDFELDPDDPQDAQQLANDADGFERNYNYEKRNFNGLLEYQFNKDVSLIASAGFSQLDATVLSGIGTVQADDFGYTYGQLRLKAGNFFAQSYININDAGNSFVYGTGQDVVDNSRQINLQAQYSMEFMDGAEEVIVGVDYERTTPDTEGTIYGRNEDDDLTTEAGFYVQSLTKLNRKLDMTIGARLDHDNIIDEIQFSPRISFVFKADEANSFRASYNRAFSAPSHTNLFLDIAGQTTIIDPTTNLRVIMQGRGSQDGFTFNNFRENQTVKFFIPVDLGNNVNLFGMMIPLNAYPVAPVYGATAVGYASMLQSGTIPEALNVYSLEQLIAIGQLLGTVAQGVSPAKTVNAVLGVPDSRETFGYKSVSGPQDIDPLKQTTTQSLEAGYKGLLGKKLLIGADVYYTQKKNFVGPLLIESPFAYLNPSDIAADVSQIITQGLQSGDPQITQLVNQLGGVDAMETVIVPTLTGIFAQTASGIVQPDQQVLPDNDPTAVGGFLAYRNFGRIEYWGMDISLQYLHSETLSFFANVSVVSDDFFDNKELNETNTDLSLALNAPTFKSKFGFAYNVPLGLSLNAAARYVKGFPVVSGSYIGDVDDYFLVDAGVGYDLGRIYSGMRFDVSIQNVLNNEHREFIGAPKVGRLALARLSYSFQ